MNACVLVVSFGLCWCWCWCVDVYCSSAMVLVLVLMIMWWCCTRVIEVLCKCVSGVL